VSFGHTLLLVGTGVITAIPLLCFGAATVRIPLSTIGMVQYLAPVLQFAVGVWINHEDMPASRWAGFGLIWAALAVLTTDALRAAQRTRRTLAAAPAEVREAVARAVSSPAVDSPATDSPAVESAAVNSPAAPADPAHEPGRAPRSGTPAP
jgi:chloramphenicol-sensitive protein RarD